MGMVIRSLQLSDLAQAAPEGLKSMARERSKLISRTLLTNIGNMLMVKTRVCSSSVHGLGLFAAEPIRKGTIVWKFTPGLDIVMRPEDLSGWPREVRDFFGHYAYLSKRTRRYVLHADNARFQNHSDTPNLLSVPVSGQVEDLDIAYRDIACGEELTTNYRDFDLEFERKILRSHNFDTLAI